MKERISFPSTGKYFSTVKEDTRSVSDARSGQTGECRGPGHEQETGWGECASLIIFITYFWCGDLWTGILSVGTFGWLSFRDVNHGPGLVLAMFSWRWGLAGGESCPSLPPTIPMIASNQNLRIIFRRVILTKFRKLIKANTGAHYVLSHFAPYSSPHGSPHGAN